MVMKGRNTSSLFRGAIAAAVMSAAMMSAAQGARAENITLVQTGAGSAIEWPIYIARAKGFLNEAGLTIDSISAPSTAAAIQQIAAGSGQIASGGLTDPMRAIDKGAKVALLRVYAQVPPYTLWAKSGIKSFDNLRKKTIIVGGAKDITRIYLDRMMEPNKMKTGDYDLVYAGTTPARLAALQSGGVDAAILLPPFSFRAEAAGYSLIGRLSDYVKDLPFSGYAVSTEWAKANRPTVIAFLKAYKRAVDWFYATSNRDEAVEILMKEVNIPRADIEATYDYFTAIKLFAPEGSIDKAAIASLVKALADDGDLAGTADPARFIDPEIAQLALQAK